MKHQNEKDILFPENVKVFNEKTGENFNNFYIKFYPKLVNFINTICKDHERAKDIATDTFLQAIVKINMYNVEKASFSTWLFIIAKNLALQDIKLKNKTISMDIEFDEEGTTLKDFIKLPNTEYENAYYESCDKKYNIMKEHISFLKDPYKTVITMREIDKMPYKDIASLLNRNLSTVKSQIRNGRRLLIKQTKKEFDEIEKSLK